MRGGYITRKGFAGHSLYQFRSNKRLGSYWSENEEEGYRQLAAYREVMGRDPRNFERETIGWEQFHWPNAKRRKNYKLTLEEVAGLTSGRGTAAPSLLSS